MIASSPPANERPSAEGAVPAPAPGSKGPLRRTSSRSLLGDAGELVIDHEGREYRLRITQNGKLILTA